MFAYMCYKGSEEYTDIFFLFFFKWSYNSVEVDHSTQSKQNCNIKELKGRKRYNLYLINILF